MADPRERFEDLNEGMRVSADRHQGLIWTAMPVAVTQDSEGHTCELQIRVKGQQRDPNTGDISDVDISPLGMVPIHFSAGGGLTITHPIKKDDEGMAVFQSRCIDKWWRDGGQQEEPYRRRHDLSDAMYIPGFRNKPRQLDPAPSNNSIQIRTDDGKFYIELTQDGVCNIYAKETNIHSPKINMDGDQRSGDKAQDISEGETAVHVKGTIHATRDISTDQSVRAQQDVVAQQTVHGRQEVRTDRVRLNTHVHMFVQTGRGESGLPRPGS